MGLYYTIPAPESPYYHINIGRSVIFLVTGMLFWFRSRAAIYFLILAGSTALVPSILQIWIEGFQGNLIGWLLPLMAFWWAWSASDALNEESVNRGELPRWVLKS
jgi:hypothetical protein